LFISLTVLTLNSCPHNSSVTALTFRVETPLHVHLRQSRHQRLLAALVSLEQIRREPPLPVLGNAQFQPADPSYQPAPVIPAPVALPLSRPFVPFGPNRLGHLCFHHLLQHLLNQRLQKGPLSLQQRFIVHATRVTFPPGHGSYCVGVVTNFPEDYHDLSFC
jgi:hypothetical protein